MRFKNLFCLVGACALLAAQHIFAQGTSFTYQGRLDSGGSPANGNYDLTFTVFNAVSSGTAFGGPVTNLNVGVTNGLFTTVLTGLPGNIFSGSNLWLEIGVRTNGGTGFTTFAPRQQLTPSPYAIFANTASNLSGTIANGQLANNSIGVLAGPGLSGGGAVALGGSTTLSNAGVLSVSGNSDITVNTIGGAVTLGDTATSANTANAIVKRDSTGSFSAQNITATNLSGNGTGVTNVNASALNGLAASNLWQVLGNSGINPTNGGFLGTTDNQPLELRVNNQRALRLEPTTSGPNVVGGYSGNFISPGVNTATIAGGGHSASTNIITASGGTIGGGGNNSVSNFNGVVTGGANNSAGGNASVVDGGSENTAIGDHAIVTGGQGNIVQSAGTHAAILGGMNNTNSGQFATVVGGNNNTASGNYSLAAGLQAQATNNGAFVWADSQGGAFGSTTSNQFNVRAGGGVRFVTGGAGVMLDGQSVLSGTVQPSQINDGGVGAYGAFQSAVQSVGGDSSVTFSNLIPVTATNSITPTLSLTIGGSAFGSVVGFSGTEAMSQPCGYVVQVQFSSALVNPNSEVGQQGVLTFTRNGRTTTFAGVVTACTLSGASASGLLYTVRMESPLNTMALTTDYKIYQIMTMPTCASKVYTENTGGTLATTLTGSYTAHDSFTQYGETSLNFFSRILESEGIFYFFNQGTSPPSLTIGDSTAAYLAVPNSPFTYYGNTASNIPPPAEFIRTFQNAVHQSSLSSTVNAYNFTTPATSLLKTSTGTSGSGAYYEFGNTVATASYDTTLATLRQQIQTVQRSTITGSGNAPDLRAGYSFTLTDQSSAGLGGSYVVTSVHHAGFVLVTNGVTTVFYGNVFQVIPASLTYRPPLVTPRPHADPINAIVVGPAGQQIYVDQYGRLKVQFFWDRYGKNDNNSSEWMRVSSSIATGSGRGAIFIPRVGDEVLVSFLEGDPDQPVIIGSLYNGGNLPPYPLPANSAISTIRSTGTGADSSLVNEIKLNDTAGAEVLSLAAAKDMAVNVNNNLNISAGQTTIAGGASINGGFQVNNGTVFTNYQAGQIIAGSSSSNTLTATILFPKTFISTPKVIATANSDPGYNVGDTFVITVRSTTTTSCVLNIVRVDQAVAWAQNLRVNWMAWE